MQTPSTPSGRRVPGRQHPWRGAAATALFAKERRRTKPIDIGRVLRQYEYNARRLQAGGPVVVEPLFDDDLERTVIDEQRHRLQREARDE